MASSGHFPDGTEPSSGNPNDRVLTYNDATVLHADLSILRGPHYLNDRLIHFYIAHLSSTLPSSSILLIPPSLSYLIANFPADPASLADVVGPLDLITKSIVMFPVNDNDDVTVAEGGSHWSLLVCCVDSKVFVHHDSSIGRVNSHHARVLSSRLRGLLGGAQFKYEEGPTPWQTNGYDCGLYVMAIARCVCEWYSKVGNNSSVLNGKEKWFGLLNEQVTGDKVHGMRGELLSLILGLAQQRDSKKWYLWCGLKLLSTAAF